MSINSVQDTKRVKAFFEDFLKEKLYEDHDGIFSKGFVVVKFMFGGKMISAKDLNPDHKQDHIVLCKTPSTRIQAESLYELLEFERKEMGSKAWKIKQDRLKHM